MRILGKLKEVSDIVNFVIEFYVRMYREGQNFVEDLKLHIQEYKDVETLPCNELSTILTALWGGVQKPVRGDLPGIISFKGKLADKNDQEKEDLDFIQKFYNIHYDGQGKEEEKERAKNTAKQNYDKARNTITEDVWQIANRIYAMKSQFLKDLINIIIDRKQAIFNTNQNNNGGLEQIFNDNNHINNNLSDILKNVVLPNGFQPDPEGVQKFTFNVEQIRQNAKVMEKKLRRAYFIEVVNNAGIPNLEEAPDLDANNIEEKWKKYVDSIKCIHEDKQSKFSKALESSLDPFFTWTGVFDDYADCVAFGSCKKGEILFSSGGATQVLGPVIQSAEVYKLDGTIGTGADATSKAYAKEIRDIMMQS